MFNLAGRSPLLGVRRRHPHPGRRASSASPRCGPVELEHLDTGDAAHRRLRHPGPHRRLDPRPRAGPQRRPRDGRGHAGAARRHGAAHQPARGVRGRQPAAPRRHRRHRRARRPTRRPTRSAPASRGARRPAGGVRLLADAPLRWVAPGLLRPGGGAPPRHRLLLWTDELVRVPTVVARQDGPGDRAAGRCRGRRRPAGSSGCPPASSTASTRGRARHGVAALRVVFAGRATT